MRIDKFLDSVNITKRRSVGSDMLKSEVVYLNGNIAKPSKTVKIGDLIEVKYLKLVKKYKILKIPTTKTIPKSMQLNFIQEISNGNRTV